MTDQGFVAHDHAKCVETGLAQAEKRCRENGLRLTPVRRATLETLLTAHRAMGAYEVLEVLSARGHGTQPPVAYRALDFLVLHGFVHKIQRLNAFVACTGGDPDHAPAFMICRMCDRRVRSAWRRKVRVIASRRIDRICDRTHRDRGRGRLPKMPDGDRRMSLVSVDRMTVRISGAPVLSNVDFAIDRGEIVTVVGPNGSGKSTLVKAIIGAVEPTSGTVTRAPDLKIGYVPQSLHLEPTLPMTTERFMALPVRHPRNAVQKALAQAGVPDLRRRQMSELSGGQFQRVLLARALLTQPDILILDEPTTGLDQPGSASFYRQIEAVRTGSRLCSSDGEPRTPRRDGSFGPRRMPEWACLLPWNPGSCGDGA